MASRVYAASYAPFLSCVVDPAGLRLLPFIWMSVSPDNGPLNFLRNAGKRILVGRVDASCRRHIPRAGYSAPLAARLALRTASPIRVPMISGLSAHVRGEIWSRYSGMHRHTYRPLRHWADVSRFCAHQTAAFMMAENQTKPILALAHRPDSAVRV